MNTTIFVIFTILSLISILFYYFGIFRYIQLHFDNNEKYIKNYKNLDNAHTKKVVISLSTTSENIKKLKPVLKSILDQTVKVNMIVLNIPKDQFTEIPEDYKDMASIIKCGKYYGLATKIIPTLLREDNKDTIIIMIDDNIIYGKDFVETLIEEYKQNNCAVVNKNAILITPEFFNVDKFNSKDKIDLKNLNNDWIKDCINTNKKELIYNENYQSFLI
jgi:hypothetical protein